MELFNEIHSRYFYIITEILKLAANHKLTSHDIASLITKLGFAETSLSLTPPLLNTNGDGYCLLQSDPPGYRSVIKNIPSPTLTTMQQRWLKTIMSDKRFALFTHEEETAYSSLLADDIQPLYNMDDLISIDMANDGDAYDQEEYKELFSTILQGIQRKKVLLITYESGKGNHLSAYFAPHKLEYSMKDDKFRLIAVRIRDQKLRSLYKLNLSRIISVDIQTWNSPPDLGAYIQNLRMPYPIEIKITNERNGFERIFTQLSNFERISEYDELTKTCLMKIYYYEVDEMELLITLLSFGPVIHVLGPESFRTQFIQRIKNQQQLLANIL